MRLIDADALKKLVDEEWFDCQDKSSFFDEIDRMPTIEQKRGKWMPYEFGDYHWHKCSVCGEADKYIETVIGGYDLESDRKFCPNCGAQMKRSEE